MSQPLPTSPSKYDEHCINDVLCQNLTPCQPPYAENWTLFDETVIEISKRFEDDSSNPYLYVFAQLHIMTRAAMYNRHIGRYEMALSLYQHINEYAISKNLTPKQVPRFYIGLASNMCVLYRNWADILSKGTQIRTLRNKSIKQAKLMERYIEMEKRNTMTSDKLIKTAYLKHYQDSIWNINAFIAKMHCERANNLHRLYDTKNEPDPQSVRECEYHYNKALEIHTANDFGIDSYYFFDAYINWIYEVRNDMRSNKKLIHKLLKRNMEIACREFGELSMETICCYKAFARYFAFYVNKYDVSIKYYVNAISLLRQCIDEKSMGNVQLNENHPLLFRLYEQYTQCQHSLAEIYDMKGDWKNALKFYQQSVSNAIIALQLNSSNQPQLKQQILKYKKDSEQRMKKIKRFSPLEKERCECKKCRKVRQKHFLSLSKKWVGGREKCLQSISENQDVSLKNMAAAKQCAHCKSKKIKLFKCSKCQKSYYCNKRHQKLHWKIHKKDCC